jgi:TPR repeat protein
MDAARCDGANASRCFDEAMALLRERGDDAVEASALLRAACGGHMEACFGLGLLLSRNGTSTTADFLAAEVLYGRACDAALAKACANLGAMYEEGWGVEPDIQRAISLYRKACDLGDAGGCSDLGYLFETGSGVAKNYGEARRRRRSSKLGRGFRAFERTSTRGRLRLRL